MRAEIIFISSVLLVTSSLAIASPPTRINFDKGASGAMWSGAITDGHKAFVLRLGKGQSLEVDGEIYTWQAIAPNGETLGCDGATYCIPGDRIESLPYSGDYVISTDYRMSGCSTCEQAESLQVTVSFWAR